MSQENKEKFLKSVDKTLIKNYINENNETLDNIFTPMKF